MNLLASREPRCELHCSMQFLRNVSFFEELTPDFLRVLAYLCLRRVYAEGDIIVKEGEPAEAAVVIVRGDAVVERGKAVIERVAEGRCVGGLSLLGRYRWLYTLRAVSEVECLVLPRSSFLPQLQAQPEALSAVARGLIATVIDREQQQLQGASSGNSAGIGMV